jgi:sortase A
MESAPSSNRFRRRSVVGGAVIAVGVALVATLSLTVHASPNSDSGSSLPAQPVAAAVPAADVLPKAPLPAAEPALAAAAWTAEHPPPPPPLPVPAALPNPASYRELTDIGRVRIPKTGVDEVMREGVEQMVIDAGPAHWPGTPVPGGWGNLVLAGHRSTKTAPFLRNGELVPGDEIILGDTTGSYYYVVTSVDVLPATALWIVDQHPGRTLTIFTCHPIGSAAERLVVRAELRSRPRPQT